MHTPVDTGHSLDPTTHETAEDFFKLKVLPVEIKH